MVELPPRTYPHGVTCWIDTEQPDPTAACAFYGELFGWTFTNTMAAAASADSVAAADSVASTDSVAAAPVYLVAQLNGLDAAGIGQGSRPASWNTYIAVTDADATAEAVRQAGGTVLVSPTDAAFGGRTATCVDPQGAEFRLWQPYDRQGALAVNVPGSWNFSDLRTNDRDGATAFYTAVFGWNYVNMGASVESMISVPGYGDHLAATVDPDIYARQAGGPEGFADVIGGIEVVAGGEKPNWHVKISVTNRDASVALAERLGATVLDTSESPWVALARIRDPQGAELTLSEFRRQG